MAEPTDTPAHSAWSQLRRRKVVQWGLAYVAAAWGVLQGLGFAVTTFDWPGVLTRVAAVGAITGLPIVITLAWYHGDRGEQRATRMEVVFLAVFLLAGALAMLQIARRPGAEPVAETPDVVTQSATLGDRKRLAVLPFANLGGDPANAAFVGGVHDTLITQIAKVPGLSVISRSSVLQFEGKRPTIREVATALHVGTVLEGSVQRDGHRLRIQAQLIDAATDEHLWADTYDRTADDLFAVQSEIALTVAEQLRIRLALDDSERLAASITGNPAAYEHYVLGRNYASRGKWRDAVREFAEAVTLDREFAAAHVQLSLARTWLAFDYTENREDLLQLAKADAGRALELDPTLPEAHLAQAVFLYRGEPDMDRSSAEFERAVAGLPNDAQAHLNFGYLRRWQGRWEDAAALFKRAAELDPGGTGARSAANALATLGRRDEAQQVIAAALAAQPGQVELALLPATLALDLDCDLGAAERVIEDVDTRFPGDAEVLRARWTFALFTGDGATAIAMAERLAATEPFGKDSPGFRLGLAQLAAGAQAAARKSLGQDLEIALADARSSPAGDAAADAFAWVGIHYALLGESAPAIEFVRRSLQELPAKGAAGSRAELLLMNAATLARAGETAAALDLLRDALALPQPRRASGFWCEPLLAPLRTEPRYRKLIEEHGGNVDVDPHRRETWPKRQPDRG